jgi:hypothetical protein
MILVQPTLNPWPCIEKPRFNKKSPDAVSGDFLLGENFVDESVGSGPVSDP